MGNNLVSILRINTIEVLILTLFLIFLMDEFAFRVMMGLYILFRIILLMFIHSAIRKQRHDSEQN